MTWYPNNFGLPFLPGYTFRDLSQTKFHRAQTLEYKNGYALPQCLLQGIGKDTLLTEEQIHHEMTLLSKETSNFMYGGFDDRVYDEFIPAHVILDKKVLRFFANFKEDIQHSSDEVYRVRPVVIYYFLEDDSMSIYEPAVENSGIPQGKRLKRQRVPKNKSGAFYDWKDLNLSIDLDVYGVKYRVTQCDTFTKNFMKSQGITLNEPEPMPLDPYTSYRREREPFHISPSDLDRLQRSLVVDKRVLRFYAMMDDMDTQFGESRPVIICYYLVDDTVEIKKDFERTTRRDHFPVLLRRQRLPKKMKPECDAIPRCMLDHSPAEVEEYYSPEDFQVGQSMAILGRRFVLCSCDDFTEKYYRRCYPEIPMRNIEVAKKKDFVPQSVVPSYMDLGTLEDSFQFCLSRLPSLSKGNMQNMLDNEQQVLRYTAKLDSQDPRDQDRRFLLSYNLSKDTMDIFEKPSLTTGVVGDMLMQNTTIPKPGTREFYTPMDLNVGTTVEALDQRFVLTGADHYVVSAQDVYENGKIPST
ncbi:EF-hand domain-containing protein 1-like [Synchiropus splendidus]|uniref:EF-hand domain-containing protein 1-like n=1 Tax=Synchiropus splendidus TaxID=270530 RepID=UPI00237EA7BE|nr:EF-hand domain-containing protein 1-like [Synchiropus splendidus]